MTLQIETHCGISCSECGGKPFHGECEIAVCCISKGLEHCGMCDEMPCAKLYAYSYLDREWGDKPPGARLGVLRRWAAQSDRAWSNVLLTSAGFESFDGERYENIINEFLSMLPCPPEQAKVLFVTTAATNLDTLKFAEMCRDELIHTGINPRYITEYNPAISADEAMAFDVVYFTGGDTRYLLKHMKETGFDEVVKKMVYSGKAYVGVSAGSLIATPNIGEPFDAETAGLCLVNNYISVHCPESASPQDDLPLLHIPLNDSQALRVTWEGCKIING